MKKSKPAKSNSIAARGPIARKVITAARERLRQKVTNLADWRDGRLRAEADRATIISREKLSEYDPLHAVYLYGQNQLSVLIEQLAELPMLDWNEYIFLAYRNHRENVVFLEGVPDQPETLPHSDAGRARLGL